MSGLMTPESLSREGSPAPAQEITLHAAGPEEAPQIVGTHLEVKTSSFTPSPRKKVTSSVEKFTQVNYFLCKINHISLTMNIKVLTSFSSLQAP